MITQIMNPNPIIPQIIQEISQNQQFRVLHQQNMKKGIFNIVKCSFNEMVTQLIAFNKNLSFENVTQISDYLKDGLKVWAYSQYKIFAWLSAWLILTNKIQLNQIIEENSKYIQMLQLFFPRKPQTFLRYQFFLMFAKTNKLKLSWKNEQIDFLAKYVNTIEPSSKGKNIKIKWRLVSFELFKQKKYLRTPNECRERWTNHLNPKVSKQDWTIEQDIKMLTIYQEYGPKWSYIAKILKSRTEHMVKNRFNSLKHKWNLFNRQTAAYNPSTVLKRLKNKLKCINAQKVLQPKEGQKCPSVSLQQGQQQHSQRAEVKSQNLTLSLFDVGPSLTDRNRQPQQNWTEVKQQFQQLEYYFQNFFHQGQNNNIKVQQDQQYWLDNLLEKRYNEDMEQYL